MTHKQDLTWHLAEVRRLRQQRIDARKAQELEIGWMRARELAAGAPMAKRPGLFKRLLRKAVGR